MPRIPHLQRHQLELVRAIPAFQRRHEHIRIPDSKPPPNTQQPGTGCRGPLPLNRHAHRCDRLPTLAIHRPLTPSRNLPQQSPQRDHRGLDTAGRIRSASALDGNRLDSRISWFRHNPPAQEQMIKIRHQDTCAPPKPVPYVARSPDEPPDGSNGHPWIFQIKKSRSAAILSGEGPAYGTVWLRLYGKPLAG